MSDFTSHLAKGENFNEGVSEREAFDIQESAKYVENEAKSLSQQYGISENESLSMLIGGGIPGTLWGGSGSRGSSTNEAATEALNISGSEEFQKNVQNIQDFAKTRAHSVLDDEGIRLSDGVSRSAEEVSSAQRQYSAARQRSEQLSETSSWMEQNSHLMRKNRTQDVLNWASDKMGFDEAKRVLTQGSDCEKAGLLTEFIGSVKSSHMTQGFGMDADKMYQDTAANIKTVDLDAAKNSMYSDSIAMATSHGFQRGSVTERGEEMQGNYMRADESVNDSFRSTSQYLHDNQNKERIKEHIHEKAPTQEECESFKDYVFRPCETVLKYGERLLEGPSNRAGINGQYKADRLPLGMKGRGKE